jgi:hypothetical protein
VKCRKFKPGETVSLYWDSVSGDQVASSVADGSGSVTISGKAPASPGGRHSAIARGESSTKRVSNSITVQPRIALSTSKGQSGDTVTVELTGFRAGEVVSLKFYTTTTRYRTVRQSVTVSARGSARFTFIIPEGVSAGSHKVEAHGNSGSTVATTFQVSVVAPANVEQAEPARPPRPTATSAAPTPTPTPEPPAEEASKSEESTPAGA